MVAKHRCCPVFSPEDADLAAYRWTRNRDGYARRSRNYRREGGKRRVVTVTAHRVVMERVSGRPLTREEVVDHKNGNRLDCRRENLRLTDRAGNSQNRKAMNPTGLRGVTFHRQAGKWQASVRAGDKTHYCGLYDTPEQAAQAAAEKREELGFLGGAS